MELATLRAQTGEARTEEIGSLNMKICDYTLVISVLIFPTNLVMAGSC